MSTPWLISWRYQNGQQNNHLVALISFFSTVGIALGVAVLIIGLSAMNGFERELNNRILAVVPQMEITGYNYGEENAPIKNWQNLNSILQKNPAIVALAPFARFTALIENGTKLKVAQIQGVSPNLQNKVSNIGQFVEGDAWHNFSEKGGIILGAGIAKSLNVNTGDWVSLLMAQKGESNKLSRPQRLRIQIAGILRLDGQLDHQYALVSLVQAQKFLNYPEQEVTGLELKVKDPFKINQIQFPQLKNYPQALQATSWTQKFGYMYRDIQLIRTIMYLAMVLVIGVACFNIISTLIMAVKDKRGDIAILRTLGANNAFIKKIFIYYGLQAGMKGCLIGIVLGVLIALNLTSIIQGFEHLIGHKILSDGIYFIDFLPSEVHWQDIVIVFICALILSLCASIYPASRAAKLQPARVLSQG